MWPVGRHIVEQTGRNHTGRLLSECLEQGSQAILRDLDLCVATSGEPGRRRFAYTKPYAGAPGACDVMVLPLSSDGVSVDALIGLAQYSDHGSD